MVFHLIVKNVFKVMCIFSTQITRHFLVHRMKTEDRCITATVTQSQFYPSLRSFILAFFDFMFFYTGVFQVSISIGL